MSRISIIVAMARNRVIGKDNKMIWHLPADLRHFKQTTMGKTLIMGRKTFESMGNLPGRTSIIITRQEDFHVKDCLIANSLVQALELAPEDDEVFIAGGGEIYKETIPLADRMYITLVDHDFDGDTFFPEYPAAEWHISDQTMLEADDRNKYSMTFLTLDRIKDPV
jgi:dihydrofolate reductase